MGEKVWVRGGRGVGTGVRREEENCKKNFTTGKQNESESAKMIKWLIDFT